QQEKATSNRTMANGQKESGKRELWDARTLVDQAARENQLRSARKSIDEALGIYEKINDWKEVTECKQLLVWAYRESAMLPEAHRAAEEALKIYNENNVSVLALRGQLHLEFGHVLREQRQPAEARAHFEKARDDAKTAIETTIHEGERKWAETVLERANRQ